MKARDFLINSTAVNAKYIANKMWPTNKAANVYLSQKLNGSRVWTETDEENALIFLKELANDIKKLTE